MTEENINAVGPSVTEEDIRLLMKRKDEIEEQIKAYYDMLQDQGDVGLHAPLVDVEGFPRADVDLYAVRTARQSICCLQNDHKALMMEIEKALHTLHANAKLGHERDDAKTKATKQVASMSSPFATVNTVTQGSPAFQAGLRVGDEVIEFGSVNTQNFSNLHDIASVVQHSEGKILRVGVIRNGQDTHLLVTPQKWTGRGLLGAVVERTGSEVGERTGWDGKGPRAWQLGLPKGHLRYMSGALSTQPQALTEVGHLIKNDQGCNFVPVRR